MKFNSKKTIKAIFGCCFALGALSMATGCTEDIDESNYAIKSEMTALDYIDANLDHLSLFKALLDRSRLGDIEGGSMLSSVLSARGNYTIFAPVDSAVSKYLEEKGFASIDEVDDETARLITYSCIIDNETGAPYETPDFPTQGSFVKTNLYNRSLTIALDSMSNYIVGGALVTKENIETSNAMIHEVNQVIAPSIDNIYELASLAPNMQISSHLIALTGIDSLMALPERDIEYEKVPRDPTWIFYTWEVQVMEVQLKRYIGYTALLETDDVYERELGIKIERNEDGRITNMDAFVAAITRKAQAAYPTATDSYPHSENNALRRYMNYHFIDGKMAYNRLVLHANEYNFFPNDAYNPLPGPNGYPTNVWDYYSTIGKYPGLVKITHVAASGFEHDEEQKMYANRISKYTNDRDTEQYIETDTIYGGACISATNLVDGVEYENNGINGFYFPINRILIEDDAHRARLGSERMRIDATTMMPELLSGNVRGAKHYVMCPKDFCKNVVRASEGTVHLYKYGGWSYYNGQADEFQFTGMFDFTLKMPPVPRDGTYELRMDISANANRGMAQIYFGEDIDNLSPCGLPVDMRVDDYSKIGPSCPWIKDTEDQIVNIENDRNLRNQGYMKAPRYYFPMMRQGQDLRSYSNVIRRIIDTRYMKANTTYYMRFKSAIRALNSQLYIDYFEYVPTNIYNGFGPEDVW